MWIGKPDDRSERALVIPCRNSGESHVRAHVQLRARIDAGWDENRATTIRGSINRSLNGPCVIGYSIAFGAELTNIHEGVGRHLGAHCGPHRQPRAAECRRACDLPSPRSPRWIHAKSIRRKTTPLRWRLDRTL